MAPFRIQQICKGTSDSGQLAKNCTAKKTIATRLNSLPAMSRMPPLLRPTYERAQSGAKIKKERSHEIHIDDEHTGKRTV
jgi:hypothetical protein